MIDRRTVLATGGIIAAGGVLAACGSADEGTVSDAAEAPEGQTAPEAAANTLSTADVPVGGGVILEESAVVVVQPAAGTYAAYTAVCPHQGCLVNEVVDNQIICPCHNSLFSAVDGAVIQGPALQGLTTAAISVDGDTITAG